MMCYTKGSERRLVNLLRGEAGEVGSERYSLKDGKGVKLNKAEYAKVMSAYQTYHANKGSLVGFALFDISGVNDYYVVDNTGGVPRVIEKVPLDNAEKIRGIGEVIRNATDRGYDSYYQIVSEFESGGGFDSGGRVSIKDARTGEGAFDMDDAAKERPADSDGSAETSKDDYGIIGKDKNKRDHQ